MNGQTDAGFGKRFQDWLDRPHTFTTRQLFVTAFAVLWLLALMGGFGVLYR